MGLSAVVSPAKMFLVIWAAELPEMHHISNSIQRNKHLTRHNGLEWAETIRNASMKHHIFFNLHGFVLFLQEQQVTVRDGKSHGL